MIQNHSEEGVYSANTFQRQTLIRNGCKLSYGDVEGVYGWTLEQDVIHEGDLVLLDDTLDLNGYSLTITGDLVQVSGVVKLNGGQLNVDGDYRMQSRSGEEGAYTYGSSSGLLQMTNAEDYVLIKGSYISDSASNTTTHLTEGTLEIKGDVTVGNAYSNYSFVTTGNHVLLLSGEGIQNINVNSSNASYSKVANLKIRNTSEAGVVFGKTLHITGNVNDHGNKVTGYIGIENTTKFTENCFAGSVYVGQNIVMAEDLIIGGDLNLSSSTEVKGNILVKGNCAQYSYLYMNNGRLEIEGNYTVTSYSELRMQQLWYGQRQGKEDSR